MTETIITSSIIIIVILALRAVLKGRVRHKLIYAMWLVAAIRLMLPFSLAESSVSVMNILKEQREYAETVQAEIIAEEIATDISSVENHTGYGQDTPIPPAEEIAHDISSVPVEEASVSNVKTSVNISEVIKVVWAAGAILLTVWFGAVNAVFNARLKRSRVSFEYNAPLKVYISDRISSPCIYGVFRPAVYITEEAAKDKEKLDFIITHELCHYRQGDMIWSAVRNVLVSLYWIDPLVWAAAVVSKRDCEMACDEMAVEILGEENRIGYGKTLVDMVAHKRKAADLAVASTSMSDGGLKERIKFIASKPKHSLIGVIALVIAVAVTAGCTFTSAKDELPTETDSIQGETNSFQSEDVSVEEVEAQRLLEEQAEFQRELEESRQEAMLELQESFVVYEFGIMSGNVPFNIRIKANSGNTVDGYIVTGNFTMYAYNNQGELVSYIPISTGATGLDGTKFDLSKAEEYFKFSKGSTIVYSHPVGDGIYLAGMYGFENSEGFYEYRIKGNEQLTNGFPNGIKASTHEMFIGDNFSFSVDDPGVDNDRFIGSTYFTDRDGKKVLYTADFTAHKKMIECGYYYYGGESSDMELPVEAVELLGKFLLQAEFSKEIEQIPDKGLVLYEYDVNEFTVRAVTKDIPDENGFVYGDYYLRIYGKSSGNFVSEIPLRSGAVGLDGIAVNAAEGDKYFQFSRPYNSFICFSYPLKDRPDDGDINYLCSLYGFDEDGQLFEYSTDDLDIELYHGHNEVKTGNFVAAESVYISGDNKEDILFRTNYSEYEDGELYTTLCGFILDSKTRKAELDYNYREKYDEEIAAAAEKAVFIYRRLLSFSLFVPLEDENTVIEEYDADGDYYQLDTSIATTEDELYAYITDAFTDSEVTGWSDLKHELFGTNPPRFKTIDGKLCYLNQYTGAPDRPLEQVMYVTDRDKSTVYILCHGIDYYTILECRLEKCADGKWRAASMLYSDYTGK